MHRLVAPFFRASVSIGPAERRLCERGRSGADFESGTRAAPEILRQNLRRLFGAAMLAESLAAPLVLVEGWRSNEVGTHGRRPRFVTGSWLFASWLRVLRRRRLLGPVSVIRRDVSRCTWEEARGILAVAASLPGSPEVIGVSDMPCPSAARAARYLAGGTVLTPHAAITRAGRPLTNEQQRFWNAVQPRTTEGARAPLVEAPNWVVHLASDLAGAVVPGPPLEQRLAAALRRDR